MSAEKLRNLAKMPGMSELVGSLGVELINDIADSYSDMYEALKRDELLANVAILATPSGPKRNKLTEINLLRLQALAKSKGESK